MKLLIALVIVIAVVIAVVWIRKTFSKEIARTKSIRRAQNKEK